MSYIRRERFAQISACTSPNFGCGKPCSEYPNGCMTGNGDCCCPGPACEGFGSYIRRERFTQLPTACTSPNFGCGKPCSEYPNGCMTGNGDCCCPGPACEGFGNVRRPRRRFRKVKK